MWQYGFHMLPEYSSSCMIEEVFSEAFRDHLLLFHLISNSHVPGEQCKPALHHPFSLSVSQEKQCLDTWAGRVCWTLQLKKSYSELSYCWKQKNFFNPTLGLLWLKLISISVTVHAMWRSIKFYVTLLLFSLFCDIFLNLLISCFVPIWGQTLFTKGIFWAYK